jgi:ribosomal protein S18 acetylase RimI-like enzyme
VVDRTVKLAGPSDLDDILQILTLAFATDPCIRYIFRSAGAFLSGYPRFARAAGAPSASVEGAWMAQDGSGAALWLPAGVNADQAVSQGALAEHGARDKFETLAKVGAALRGFHPQEPHWHLVMLGVDPACQGRGLGSVLLRADLERCDEAGAPAFLENSNPRNTPLYVRHGFEVIGTVQPDDFPPLQAMVRPARRVRR